MRHHQLVVAAQLLGAERVLHDPPVVQVLLEVEQHQPAVEERPDEVGPGGTAGERLVPVDEDPLEGVRPGERVHVHAEDPHPVDGAVVSRAATPSGRSGRGAAAAGGSARPGGRSASRRRLSAMRRHSDYLRDMLKQSRSNVSSAHVAGDPASDEPELPAPGLPLGPDSLTWQLFADNRMALLGPRAAVLQNMLPGARPGRGGPLGVVRRDPGPAGTQHPADLRHGLRADPVATGHQVRDFHTHDQGQDAETGGSPTARSTPRPTTGRTPPSSSTWSTATDTFIRPLEPAPRRTRSSRSR